MNRTAAAETNYIEKYAKFVKLHGDKNWNAIAASIQDVPNTNIPSSGVTHYEAHISCLLFSLSQTSTASDRLASNVAHLADCYGHLLTVVAAAKDHGLSSAIGVIAHLDRNGTDLSVLGTHYHGFMRKIRCHLKRLLDSTNVRTRQLMVGLVKCVVTYAKIEFVNGGVALEQTAKLLAVVAEVAATTDMNSGAWKLLQIVCRSPLDMAQLEKYIKIMMSQHSKTSIDGDIMVGVAGILYANKDGLPAEPDLKMSLNWFGALSLLANSLANAAASIIVCYICKTNATKHAIINVVHMAQIMFVSHLKKRHPIDAVWLAVAKLTALQLNTMDSLVDCTFVSVTKQSASYQLNEICRLLQDSSYASLGVQFLNHIITNAQTQNYLDHCTLMKALFLANDRNEQQQPLQIVRTGCVLAALMLHGAKEASMLMYTMQSVCKAQIHLGDEFSVEEYFNEINYKFMARVPIPTVSISELLLCQLRMCNGVDDLTAKLRSKLIDRIHAKTRAEPMQFLRVAYCYESCTPTKDQFERMLEAYDMVKQKVNQLTDAVRIRWHCLVGTMEVLSYLVAFKETTEQYKEVQIDLKQTSPSIFRDLNLKCESQMLRLLLNAIKAYKKFTSVLSKDNMDTLGFEIEHAVRNVKYVAVHLNLRYYRKEAMVAYTVLYSLSTKVNDKFGCFAAIGHFAGNSNDYPSDDTRNRKALRKIIESNFKVLIDVLKTREQLNFNKQASLLQCLMNIGLYYVEQGSTDDGSNVLDFVEQTMNDFEKQFNMLKNHSFRMRLNTIILVLITKHDMYSPFLPIQLAEHIIECTKSMKFVCYSEREMVPIALHDSLVYINRYCMARYDLSECESVVLMLLKMAMRQGLVYKAAKLLTMYCLVDLYKEDDANCLIKLKNLDDLVTLFDNGNRAAGDPQKLDNMLLVPAARSLQYSPVRKQVGHCVSPIKVMNAGQDVSYEKYLIEHRTRCDCVLCSNDLIKELLLEMAWLHARTFFVRGDFESCVVAFQVLHRYWMRHKDLQQLDGRAGSLIERLSFTNCMWLWHYGQSLTRVGRYVEALEMLTLAGKWYRNSDFVDVAIQHDLSMQLEVVSAMIAASGTPKPKRLHSAETQRDIDLLVPMNSVVTAMPLVDVKQAVDVVNKFTKAQTTSTTTTKLVNKIQTEPHKTKPERANTITNAATKTSVPTTDSNAVAAKPPSKLVIPKRRGLDAIQPIAKLCVVRKPIKLVSKTILGDSDCDNVDRPKEAKRTLCSLKVKAAGADAKSELPAAVATAPPPERASRRVRKR